MAVFTVHQPPLGKTESTPDPTRFTFVRDGFYFWGFVFSALWMLRHRLWLVAVLFIALSVLIQIGLKLLGAPSAFHTVVAVALAFLVGLEGATLRRWTLARRGWTNVGVVIADNEDDAERRFFVNWQAGRRPNAAPPPRHPQVAVVRMARNTSPDVIGSFPQLEPPR